MDDGKLEEIITVVEENLEYENLRSYCDNCDVYGIVNNREQVKKYIAEIITGDDELTSEQEDLILEEGLEKWREQREKL